MGDPLKSLKNFRKKVSQCRKKLQGWMDPLGFFNISVTKHQKN